MSAECPRCGSTDLLEWTINGRVGMECRVCSHTWDPNGPVCLRSPAAQVIADTITKSAGR